MITPATAFSSLPPSLRDPLIVEYRSITRNYQEHRWQPSELAGGIFCEIVYTILDGYSSGTFAAAPIKPRNFSDACRRLESNTNVPHSFRILIPRALPALYDIRNNRGVGHAGGDVDSNYMDATLVLGMCSWIMAELVRVFHALPIPEAQQLVDHLADRAIPLVWEGQSIRRVLDTSLKLWEQVIILLASKHGHVKVSEVLDWTDYGNKAYFLKMLRQMHQQRLIELSKDKVVVEILPPGSRKASEIIARSQISFD